MSSRRPAPPQDRRDVNTGYCDGQSWHAQTNPSRALWTCLEMPGRTLFEVRDELSAVAEPATPPAMRTSNASRRWARSTSTSSSATTSRSRVLSRARSGCRSPARRDPPQDQHARGSRGLKGPGRHPAAAQGRLECGRPSAPIAGEIRGASASSERPAGWPAEASRTSWTGCVCRRLAGRHDDGRSARLVQSSSGPGATGHVLAGTLDAGNCALGSSRSSSP